METIEYRTVDKSAWGSGPWQDEPDKRQWRDPETGLPCLIVRNGAGALCGYVGVSEGHPAYLKDYNDVDVSVHGGLTFAGGCSHGDDPAKGICHKPGDGAPDAVHWLGFDTAHSGDFCPKFDTEMREMLQRLAGRPDVYRDMAYVTAEVASLAKQLAAMKEKEE